ncbi:tyrosine-type recombinase/integrase [Amycolatopsis sp. K13G38]|uniref:Tyrosine-type recombinase/integrase n=1 Tax=Amycolatopsis acididurans TaxID=2724524 RepID=A0ABX1JBP5_9PSEU|nr:tyrosine-type recombinase/integrase [Amycolatopsis acididurans]
MAGRVAKKRPKGSVRKRGKSFQVNVYAGIDPLTGRRLYLSESTTDERQVDKILRRLLTEVDEREHARTKGTLRAAIDAFMETHEMEASTRRNYKLFDKHFIGPALGGEPVSKIDARALETFYAQLRRCRRRCDGRPFIEHRTTDEHECRVVRHKRPPGRRPADGYPEHDCAQAGCKVIECKPHVCDPLPPGTVLKIHYALSAIFAATVRWGWLQSNPCDVAKKPSQAPPQPKPPSTDHAAKLVEAAWNEDPMWGTLVWLVFVTGVRRSEVLALRWTDLAIERLHGCPDVALCVAVKPANCPNATIAGKLAVQRAVARVDGVLIEKDTKTHQMRLISLDSTTTELLEEHRQRYEATMRDLDADPAPNALMFSYAPTADRLADPDAVTRRYTNMGKSLGIDSNLHALRHYAATELLTAGVDLRTVAGRLGHGGGGATTLRVYAAWQNESDRRAAEILGGRLTRPTPRPNTESGDRDDS